MPKQKVIRIVLFEAIFWREEEICFEVALQSKKPIWEKEDIHDEPDGRRSIVRLYR